MSPTVPVWSAGQKMVRIVEFVLHPKEYPGCHHPLCFPRQNLPDSTGVSEKRESRASNTLQLLQQVWKINITTSKSSQNQRLSSGTRKDQRVRPGAGLQNTQIKDKSASHYLIEQITTSTGETGPKFLLCNQYLVTECGKLELRLTHWRLC